MVWYNITYFNVNRLIQFELFSTIVYLSESLSESYTFMIIRISNNVCWMILFLWKFHLHWAQHFLTFELF